MEDANKHREERTDVLTIDTFKGDLLFLYHNGPREKTWLWAF